MKKISVLILVALVVMLISCSKKGSETVNVGIIVPLTGPSATLGNLHKNGFELAAKELNESGKLGFKLNIVYEDSKNDAKTGIAAYRKLTSIDKTKIIMSTFSGVCVPIASTIKSEKKDDLIFLATATSAPDITIGSNSIFRSFIISTTESKKIAEFITTKLKYKKVAIYCVQDDYGLGAATVLKQEFLKTAENRIVFEEFFDKTQIDHRNALLKIKNSKADIVFITGYDQSLVSLIKQFRELKLNMNLISTATFTLPTIYGNLTDPEKEGIYFVSSLYDSDFETNRIFKEKYNSAYPKSKDNYQSAATYTLMKLFGTALSNASSVDLNKIKAELLKITNYDSPLGSLSFDSNREAPYPVKIKMVKNALPVDAE